MDRQYAVVMYTNGELHGYGPLDEVRARAFAAFLTAEVDPAHIITLTSPADELMAWYETGKASETPAAKPPGRVTPGDYIVGADGIAYGPILRPGEQARTSVFRPAAPEWKTTP